MAAIKLDQNGLPINPDFFGGGGLGGALASLPGTPVLGGGRMPVGPGGEGLTPGQPPPGTAPPEAPGGGINGYRSDTGYGSPLAGGAPQTNPGLPPPASTAGTGGFFGGQSPFQQGVTGTLNNETVPFNSNQYVTPDAAQRLGSLLGANVVSQNTQGMASPGSGAPSAPLLGLDFGGQGDVQDAAMGATQLARGDRPEDVAARYQAGRTTKAWAGDNPIPQLAENWDAPYWNRSTPVSTNTPNAEQAGFFGQGGGSPDQQQAFFTWLRGQLGQG